LDGRFKFLPFLKPEEKDDIATAIIEEAVHLTPVSRRTNDDTDSHDTWTTPKPKRPRVEHVLLEILSDVFSSSTTRENEVLNDPPCLQASLEMKAYMKEETTNDCPLQWWKRNAFHYPLLSKMYKDTCVFLLHLCQVKGYLVQLAKQKRTCLLPENVVFLAENLQ